MIGRMVSGPTCLCDGEGLWAKPSAQASSHMFSMRHPIVSPCFRFASSRFCLSGLADRDREQLDPRGVH
jgi:hypothetical protein